MYNKVFSEKERPETITIIGCGIAGASLAYQLAKQAKELNKAIKIRVIEQVQENQMPNPLGSSYGKARITRMATAEGEEYIPYAKRSQEIAAELQIKTGKTIHIHSGGLIIGPNGKEAWPAISAHYAKKNHIPCDVKKYSQLAQYPALKVHEEEIAYFEPSMGIFVPETCQAVLINQAKELGVEFIFGEHYQKFDEKSFTSPMVVHTDKKSYPTDKLILAMGPWAQKELSQQLKTDVAEQFSVHISTMYSFKVEESALQLYDPASCPVLIWQTAEKEAFVFFPDVDSSGTVHFALFPITDLPPSKMTPEEVKKAPALESAEEVFKKYIAPHFKGISPVCLTVNNYPFTMNRGEKFIYASLPDHPNVRLMDPGSGHGYKHAFAFAEQIAQHLLVNKSQFEVEKTFGSFFEEMKNSLKLGR